ncbi:MAG TPA: NAD(P)-dependent alcohol dehydrogenase [Natronosporangium sp.]
MKAITHDRFGGPDVLTLSELPQPTVGERDVLVRVRAASVSYGDYHYLTGTPLLGRIGFGLRGPRVPVRGTDLAGVVEAVGAQVTGFRPGDEVFGWCKGAFAEYAMGTEDTLLPKPANASFEQAAAVPSSGMTALQGLDKAKVRAGQRVLILGAGGGVGTFAVQIAKARGAWVTGVCSTSKVALVEKLGADQVIDYTRGDPLRTDQPYDVIVDLAGSRPVPKLRAALAPAGTLLFAGGEGGGRIVGDLSRSVPAALRSMFSRQRLLPFVSLPRKPDLASLAELIEAGKLTPVVGQTYPLARTADAFRDLVARRANGKLVITG